jgi:hypothetical protein
MNFEDIIKKYRIGKDSRVVFKNDPKTYYVLNIAGDRKSLFVYDGVNKIPPKNKQLVNLIKVDGKEVIKENACNCGCGGCAKAPILNEQLVAEFNQTFYVLDINTPLEEFSRVFNFVTTGGNFHDDVQDERRDFNVQDVYGKTFKQLLEDYQVFHLNVVPI